MKSISILFIAIIAVLLGYTTFAVQAKYCGKVKCPTNDLCCPKNVLGYYYQCYNPYTYSCSADKYRPEQNCLCGKTDSCCNGACYNVLRYFCDLKTGTVQKRPIIPKTKGTTYTNPNQCGTFRCSSSDSCCHNNIIGAYKDVCYSTETHVCTVDKYKPSYNCLCGLQDSCCNGVCFDKYLYKCSYGKIVQK